MAGVGGGGAEHTQRGHAAHVQHGHAAHVQRGHAAARSGVGHQRNQERVPQGISLYYSERHSLENSQVVYFWNFHVIVLGCG